MTFLEIFVQKRGHKMIISLVSALSKFVYLRGRRRVFSIRLSMLPLLDMLVMGAFSALSPQRGAIKASNGPGGN